MPKYDRTCSCLTSDEVEARFAAGEQAAIRFRVPDGDVTFEDLIHGPITFSSDVIGDFIIKRTDGGFSYNFAVVVDDAGMEITDVIRGEDHITNTARQMMLFAALGKAAPALRAPLAHPGSRRQQALQAARSHLHRRLSGTWAICPAAMVNYLALLSWHPADEREKFSLDELIAGVRASDGSRRARPSSTSRSSTG